MKHFLKLFFKIVALSLLPILSFSQNAYDSVEMADVMRSNGKIYVVIVVLLIIFSGLAIFLISIDRKVRRLEKDKK
ncbi:MAG: CcmD family protein [Bacteroidia bacterium]|nr:CcmD family protein [Bacteroidia bacterium]